MAYAKYPLDPSCMNPAGGLQCSSDYLSEDMKITALMAEYAERDKQYGGVPGQGSEDSSPGDGPPRPVLMCAQYGF